MKKSLAVLLALILVFTMSFASLSYGTTKSEVKGKISEKKSELSEGEKKADELEDEIKSLVSDIDEMQTEIDKIKGKINDTKIKVREVKKDLKAIEDKIEKQSDELNSRLRTMYMNDNTSFVDVILNSGSISELLTNLELIKRIHKSDKELLEKLEDQHKQVEKDKKKLDKLMTSLKEQKEECDKKQNSLEAEKAEVTKKKKELDASNKKKQNQIDELQEELAEMEAESQRIASQIKGQGSTGKYSGSMVWPCSGPITSSYGYRYCPYHGYELHSGIDISVSTGTSVVAASGGVVTQAYYNSSYGNMVVVDHGSGISTLYAHNSSLKVSVGQKVSQGQTIALAGSTGNSTGPHCHFEVRLNGQPVNPLNYL